ncbi:uncharacterized protein LOC121868970 [Homarus americanus]|uniref:uncharacterized protein LOC121868970 n=1 Tax=Homarus americanus TaxID=6706 RepID=UPI001C464D93|nr:uncharacterized protein LOC121868970 [Homarus americanus]
MGSSTAGSLSSVPGASLIEVADGAWVWICDDPTHIWASGFPVILTYPDDPNWEDPGSCILNSDTENCIYPPRPLDHAGFTKNLTLGSAYVFAVYYQCEAGWMTLSGMHGVLAQCKGGVWASPSDICIECKFAW